MFSAYRHLGSDPDLPDTILKGDHPRTRVTKFVSDNRSCEPLVLIVKIEARLEVGLNANGTC
jgi:hypothetical protein